MLECFNLEIAIGVGAPYGSKQVGENAGWESFSPPAPLPIIQNYGHEIWKICNIYNYIHMWYDRNNLIFSLW